MIFSLKQGLAVSLKKDKGCLADEARLSRSPLSPLGWDITWGGAGGYRLNKKSPARPAAAPLGRGPKKKTRPAVCAASAPVGTAPASGTIAQFGGAWTIFKFIVHGLGGVGLNSKGNI